MDIHDLKKEQWDKNYENNKFVTDEPVSNVFRYHQLPIPSDKSVLYVGVGYTNFIKELSQNNSVIGVDVSEKALQAVEPFCESTYFSKDLSKAKPVDLAVCNLVLQHNHEYEVRRIINDVNLKDDGMFSFQFASLNSNNLVMTKGTMDDINNSMLYFYSAEKMKALVEATNKKVVNVIGPIWFDAPYNFNWYIFHVNNK